MKIVWIGAGNLATQLGEALHRAGHETLQVFSRTMASAEALAGRLGCPATDDLDAVVPGADVYIFSVKDGVLEGLVSRIAPRTGDALCLHTAGSMPISVFEGLTARYGVVYALQTFSKSREVDFKKIPFFPCILSYKTTNNRYSYCSDTEFSSDAIRNTDFPSYAI